MTGRNADHGELSPREEQVLRLLATGATNGETAGLLGIAESTLREHCARIRRKLEVETYQQMIVWAVRQYG